MELASSRHRFKEAKWGNFAIDCDGNVGAKPPTFEQTVFNARVLCFQIRDDLTDGGTFDIYFGATARQVSQESGDEDFWHQMASMIAGGFIGSRVIRVPIA